MESERPDTIRGDSLPILSLGVAALQMAGGLCTLSDTTVKKAEIDLFNTVALLWSRL